MRLHRRWILLALSTCLAALAAGCARGPRLVVGSKNFTEQLILGEIIAQHLERRLGQRVERKLNLGGTLLAHQALAAGHIDLYPEYTGTALTAILKLEPLADSAAVLERVRREYRERFGLLWLDPLGFDNSFAMVVRGEQARSGRLRTLSEAAAWRKGWSLGAGYEFQQRADGLAALTRTYGFQWRGTARVMDLGLLYQALEQKQVDMVAASATDGLLSKLDVQVLADDRRAFPPYQAAVVARLETLARIPTLRAALEEISGKFPEATMRRLNHALDGEHRPLAEVAAQFLREAGLEPAAPAR